MKINVTMNDGHIFRGGFSNKSESTLEIIVPVNDDEQKKTMGELLSAKITGVYSIRENYNGDICVSLECEHIRIVEVE